MAVCPRPSPAICALGNGESSSGWVAFDVPSPHGYIVYAPNADGQPLPEWQC